MEEAEIKPLTKRQLEALDFIKTFISKNAFSPTVREIGDGLGLQSSSTAYGFVQRLKEAGVVNYDPGSPRSLTVVGFKLELEMLREEVAELRAENAKLKFRLSQEEATANG